MVSDSNKPKYNRQDSNIADLFYFKRADCNKTDSNRKSLTYSNRTDSNKPENNKSLSNRVDRSYLGRFGNVIGYRLQFTLFKM